MKHPPKSPMTKNANNVKEVDFPSILSNAADGLSQGLIIFERSPINIVYANKAAESIMGYKKEVLISLDNKPLADLIHKDDLQKVRDFLVNRDSHAAPSSLEHRFIRGDASVIWVKTQKTHAEYDGKEYGVFIFSDVTEKKLEEEEISKREERYRLLYENLSDALFITDINGNITMCNAQATDLFGYSQDELLGMDFIQLTHQDERDRIRKAFQKSLAKGKTREEGIVVRILRKDGRSFYYHVTSSLILHHGEPIGFQSLIRDITESKQSEIRLTNYMKDLELYSSFMKHDIRHELQLIATSTGILSESHSAEDSATENYKIIRDAVSRITDILDFMNTDDAASTSDDIIENLEVSALRAMRQHDRMKVIMEINPKLRDISLPRGALIGLIFNNLFQNAAIHGGESVEVRVKVRIQDKKLIIDFIDDGPGVDENIRETLFRKGASTLGSGLGLYLSKRVIEEYNGTIELVDDQRKGATFRISLPLAI